MELSRILLVLLDDPTPHAHGEPFVYHALAIIDTDDHAPRARCATRRSSLRGISGDQLRSRCLPGTPLPRPKKIVEKGDYKVASPHAIPVVSS